MTRFLLLALTALAAIASGYILGWLAAAVWTWLRGASLADRNTIEDGVRRWQDVWRAEGLPWGRA